MSSWNSRIFLSARVFPDKGEQSQALFTFKTEDLAYTLCLFLVENLTALNCSISKAFRVASRCWKPQESNA